MYYKIRFASLVYLLREVGGRKQVLLQQRGGPGKFGAGYWDASAAGHVDEGESILQCIVREAVEEIGIEIDVNDVTFCTTIHMGGCIAPKDTEPYINVHFFIEKFKGDPKVCECEKCSGLKWFYIDELPEKMFADRGHAIRNYLENRSYSEVGF